jgi:hypothetical protein
VTTYNAGDASLRIIPDARNFKRDLEAELKKVEQEFSVKVLADIKRAREEIDRLRAEEEARPVNVRLEADRKRSHADFEHLGDELGHKFEQAFSARIATIGVGLLPAAALAVAELAGAVDQLAGASVLLPAAMAGAVAVIGDLALGVHGVGEAYKALEEQTKTSAQDQLTHSRELQSANYSLQSAVREEGQAERERAQAVREARQEYQDLALQLRGGKISEAEALLAAQRARRDLVTGHYRTALDYEEAQLHVVAADQRVAEAHQHNIELSQKAQRANEQGIENNDRVVAANNHVADSQQRVAEAQTRVETVNRNFGASALAAQRAMALLAPNAQEFVRAMHDLTVQGGPIKELQKGVQQDLFAGMAASMKSLVASDLPTFQKGLTGIARALNQDFGELFKQLGTDQTKGLLDRLFGSTANAQQLLKGSIEPIVHAFGTLAAVGSDSFPRLANAIGAVAQRFDHFIGSAAETGKLDKWINNGLTGFREFGNILINLAQSVHAVTQAIGGQGLLALLETGSKRLADFLKSTHGQNTLAKFFAEAHREVGEILPVIKDLGPIFAAAWGAAKDATAVYLPILREVAGFLKDNPGLVKAIAEAYITWKTIGPIMDGVKAGLGAITDLTVGVGTGFYQTREKAKEAGEDIDETFKKSGHSSSPLGKFASFVGSFGAVAGPFGLMATGITSLVLPALDALTSHTDTVKEHMRELNTEADRLAETLEAVTNLTGLQTRTELSKQFVDYHSDKGLSGNVLQAAAAIGIGGTGGQDLITAALPGGEKLYDQYTQQIRAQVGPVVDEFINSYGPDAYSHLGVSRDDLIDAFLGKPDALAKLQRVNDSHPEQGVDLGLLKQRFEKAGGPALQAALVGQALNFERSSALGIVPRAQQAQAAAVPQPHLVANSPFGPEAGVVSDGRTTKIVTSHQPTQDELAAVTPGTTPVQGVAPNQNTWTWTLSADDIRKYTYEKGGPTKDSGGGYPAILHPKEYVANARGRATLGDEFLAAANQGRVDMSLLPHFDQGGPGDGPSPKWVPGKGFVNSQGNSVPGPNDTASERAIFQGAPAAVSPVSPSPVSPSPVSSLLGQPAQTPAALPAGAGLMPGLWGLAQVNGDPQLQDAWNQQTLGWLANWGGNLVGQLGDEFLGGVLGGFGLDKSILSPHNAYTKDAIGFGGSLLSKLGIGFGFGGRNPDVNQFLQTGDLPQTQGLAGLSPELLRQIYSPQTAASSTGATTAAASSSAPSPTGTNQQVVHQAMLAAGFPESEWGALYNLMMGESGFQNTVKNPKSTAYGMFQFLDSTWANVGGTKTDDPATQAKYGLQYIKQRYGTPSAAWAFWQSQSPHWYDEGGWLPEGLSLTKNDTGKPEAILTHDQGKAIQEIGAAAASGAPLAPQPDQQTPQPNQQHGPAPEPGAAPKSSDHTNPALAGGIKGAFDAAGNIAGTAAQIGVAAGTFGAGAPAGGAAASLASGAFKLAGGIATGAANIGSSLLVGTLSGGTSDRASGVTYHPAQQRPHTAPGRTINYGGFYGHDTDDVLTELNIRDSQQQQSWWSNHRP